MYMLYFGNKKKGKKEKKKSYMFFLKTFSNITDIANHDRPNSYLGHFVL